MTSTKYLNQRSQPTYTLPASQEDIINVPTTSLHPNWLQKLDGTDYRHGTEIYFNITTALINNHLNRELKEPDRRDVWNFHQVDLVCRLPDRRL